MVFQHYLSSYLRRMFYKDKRKYVNTSFRFFLHMLNPFKNQSYQMWQKCDWKENLSHPATFLTYFCKQLYEWLTEDFAWEMIKVLKKIPASFSCPFRRSVCTFLRRTRYITVIIMLLFKTKIRKTHQSPSKE